MRKEVLFAIIAGVLFGAVLAFGIWRANSALKEQKPVTQASPTPGEQREEVGEIRLSLASPRELDVITESPVEFTGATKPDVWVAISAEEEDYIFKSAEDGSISQEVGLVGGVNQILVVSIDDDGKVAEENLIVVFSTEFEKGSPPETTSEQSKEATDSVREKVQEKLEEARLNPKAYLGTITDLLEETIQIKSDEGEIQQISVDDKTVFVKTGVTPKNVKFSDVAIGDYAISLGYVSDSKVLDASRVLISSSRDDLNRRVVFGKTTKVAKGEITLETQEGELTIEAGAKVDVTLELDDDIDNIAFSEIEEGYELIAIGSSLNATLEARRIHVIR